MEITSNLKDFYSGDTLNFKVSTDEISSLDNINLKVVFMNAKNPKIEIIATNNNDGSWSISKTASETQNYGVGKYSVFYVFYNSFIGYVKQESGGSVNINTNILNTVNYDFRSENQKMLDMVRDRIAGRLTDGMNSFTINGRSVVLMSVSELLTLEKDLIVKVENELAQKDKKEKGKTNRNKLSIRYKGVI